MNFIVRTVNYLKRNGFSDTVAAVLERLEGTVSEDGSRVHTGGYAYVPPAVPELSDQRRQAEEAGETVLFSILVPVYRTPEAFLRDMINSCLDQSYPYFELILADAGDDDTQKMIIDSFDDMRIRYIRLGENRGISENTNAAMRYAKGDYIVFLDHDDTITPDALFHMWRNIEDTGADILYSDEDKMSEDGSRHFEPHFKKDFDRELLLSNNYICHLTAARRETAVRIGLRSGFDGAQDYDFLLRLTDAVSTVKKEGEAAAIPTEIQTETQTEIQTEIHTDIIHIPKVLYHWRIHSGSTAGNTASKEYAYPAGKRALEEYAAAKGWKVNVREMKHRGFYRMEYTPDIFAVRPDVGMLTGRLVDKSGRIIGGMLDENGRTLFQGLKDGFSGYMHRASLRQECAFADMRHYRVRPELEDELRRWMEEASDGEAACVRFRDYCSELRKRGMKIIWDPEFVKKAWEK